VTAGRVSGQSTLFQGMNLLGAAGFVVNGWWHRALPSTALNVVWALIGAWALWRIWTGRSPTSTK